jgi:hypothetical protein
MIKVWTETRESLTRDLQRVLQADSQFDPDIKGADLGRYSDNRHPSEGGAESYRVAFEWGEGPVKLLVPSPRMIFFLMSGYVVRHLRVIGDDPATGLPIVEGTGELLPPMTEREAVEFIAWRDIPRGCNRTVIITTKDLPASRVFRDAWRLPE